MPTFRTTSAMDRPSATSTIIRARRTSPVRKLVERCHDSNAVRSSSERRIVTVVLRPCAMTRSSSNNDAFQKPLYVALSPKKMSIYCVLNCVEQYLE